MNGLAPDTQALIYAFAGVSLLALWAALAVTVKGWPGLGSPWWSWRRTRAAVRLARHSCTATLGFLERASRDIVAGFLNAVEWLIYGRRYA